MVNKSHRSNRTPIFLIGLVCLMLSASFAAVPFYDWFCKVTGYGGTPEIYSDTFDLPVDTLVNNLYSVVAVILRV